MVQKFGEKRVLRVGKISSKIYILTVKGKQIVSIVNNTKRIFDLNLCQIELETRWFKAAKMSTKKLIENEK